MDYFENRLKNGSLKVGFMGSGNMAQAILGALISTGTLKPAQIHASAPSDTRLAPLRRQGVNTTHDNHEIVRDCDVVFICVKPHIFSSMDLKPNPNSPIVKENGTVFISVMAGLSLKYITERMTDFGGSWPKWVIRSMPNTPSLVGEGCCVYAADPSIPAPLLSLTQKLLQCLGFVRQIPESLINAAAAVSGSGPAYMYIAIESLADGGVKMGLPRELAMSLAAQTVRGAATMVQKTGRHPGQLKDEVCSPGGTTIAAVHALEKQGFRNSLICAVEAGTNRAQEVAQQNQK